MKKLIAFAFTFIITTTTIIPCFAMDSNDIAFAHYYDVTAQQDGSITITDINGVCMEGLAYEKDNCIMLPLKTVINTENKHYTANRQAVYTKNQNTATVTLDGKEITFFEGKREVTIDGKKRGLYTVPDIKQNDVFVATEDLYVLLNMHTRTNSNKFIWEPGCKQIGWYFRGDDGAHINNTEYEQKKYRLSVEYDGTLFEGKFEKNMPAYQKNGHFMIGLKEISYFVEPKILLETNWDKQNNQLFIKTWDGNAKDIVLQKDSNIMTVNGVAVKMEEKAEIKNDCWYIPITALFDILDIPQQNINWIEKGKNVSIVY